MVFIASTAAPIVFLVVCNNKHTQRPSHSTTCETILQTEIVL